MFDELQNCMIYIINTSMLPFVNEIPKAVMQPLERVISYKATETQALAKTTLYLGLSLTSNSPLILTFDNTDSTLTVGWVSYAKFMLSLV